MAEKEFILSNVHENKKSRQRQLPDCLLCCTPSADHADEGGIIP
ncbi:MAG: hypothetical protein ABR974_01295 [Bacteroidales bacterium]